MATLILQFGKTFANSVRHISFLNRQLLDKINFEAINYTETLGSEKKISLRASNERSINDVSLLGRIGGKPTLATGMNSLQCVKFLLATRSLRARKERGTDWHEVVCYDEELIDFILDYIDPGDKVFLQGAINYVEPPPEQSRRYPRSQIVVRKLIIARKKDPRKEDSDS